MKVYYNKIIPSLFLVGFLVTKAAYPQFTTSAGFLLQSLGARGLALGESYVAVADGGHSLYWNPAGLLTSQRSLKVAFSHRPELRTVLFDDFLNFEHGTLVYQPNSRLAVAAHITYVDFGSNTVGSKVLDSYSYTVGASLAAQVVKNLTAGLTIKRISQELPPESAHSFAADLGAIYSFQDIVKYSFH